ncbi:histidine phosphatase family protein, partial [Marinitenerispora sediminis]|uniref:histidine phosphatase family protein n=1 Tax=Marinitenerispora sediminis TaxID=1931232 RepID=UPI001C69739E
PRSTASARSSAEPEGNHPLPSTRDLPFLAELTVVRHGESLANAAFAEAEAHGHDPQGLPARDADVPLSGRGEKQARRLGENWLARLPAAGRPGAVVVSPYVRAGQTARTALAAARLDLPLYVDERLRDREMGVLELLTPAQIRRRFPEEAERRARTGELYYRAPGGESWADVALRTRSLLTDLHGRHAGERVLVVAHDATLLLLRTVIDGLDEAAMHATPPARNAAVTRWVFQDRFTSRLVDDDEVGHLAG